MKQDYHIHRIHQRELSEFKNISNLMHSLFNVID